MKATHLVTKFVITILIPIAVGDPDWQARSLDTHPLVKILPQTVTKPIRSSTQRINLRSWSPRLSTAFFRPPFPWVLGSRSHASEVLGRSFAEALALMLDDIREADWDFSRWRRGEGAVWSLRAVWYFLDMGGAVGDVVDVGEVARMVSGVKLVGLVKGLTVSAFADRMAGVGVSKGRKMT